MTSSPEIRFFVSSISTHTLTWSVTIFDIFSNAFEGISTHTLTWSVTQSEELRVIIFFNFNSHAHVERDWLCCKCSERL